MRPVYNPILPPQSPHGRNAETLEQRMQRFKDERQYWGQGFDPATTQLHRQALRDKIAALRARIGAGQTLPKNYDPLQVGPKSPPYQRRLPNRQLQTGPLTPIPGNSPTPTGPNYNEVPQAGDLQKLPEGPVLDPADKPAPVGPNYLPDTGGGLDTEMVRRGLTRQGLGWGGRLRV